MPINLKYVLQRHGLTAAQWLSALHLIDGSTPSPALGSQILNWDQWPKRTPRTVLQQQTVDFLTAHDVPDTEIKTIWQMVKPDKQGARRTRTGHLHPDCSLPETDMLSHKAKQFFSIFSDPFVDDVQSADDVYLSADQRYIREAMLDCARHGGFRAIVGESGAGKSVLRRDLIDRIRRDELHIVTIMPAAIDKTRLTASHIADAIVDDISSEAPKRTMEAKARQIQRLLAGSARAGQSHVLIIEEAHDLAVPTLKYLKRFWELEDGFHRLLGILLIGQPELKDRLNVRINWDAREVINRIEIAELQPLDNHLQDYIKMKLERVGLEAARVFDDDAYDAIRDRLMLRRNNTSSISMTYPLMVNNTVTKAINLAADLGVNRVNAEIVRGV